jgi:glutathione S-transferase
MALDFYLGHGSPYAWPVWLALEYKQVPYKLNVLSFAAGDTRKPEFVALNPRHIVPTIVDEGFVLWESVVILEYLDERFSTGAKLYPGNVRERARIRRLVREAEGYLDRQGIDVITTEYFSKEGAAPDAAKVDAAKKVIREELEFFAQELQGDWLSREGMSAADIVLYPWVAYVKRITVRKPESKLADLLPDRIVAWARRIEALPYFDKTFPPHWR